ncbi:MAG TPA: homoserine kinase [Opitutaceae bacterium]|nr:homoserine kinase [Opitutaceae bacterium]
MSHPSVTVQVPASTSNCGAGFDTLGLALSIYNRVTVTLIPSTAPRAEQPSDAQALDMVTETAEAFFSAVGREPVGFLYRIEGEVPPARGLGSSITVIAGVLAGLDALLATKLSRHRLVEIATALEGHPDNASAGILGGFCVSRCEPASGKYVDTVRFELPETLKFVVASPAVELLTKASRGVLPTTLPFFDAVKSINSATYLVAVIASGDYEKLRGSGSDFMHEPHRLPGIKGGADAIAAGVRAGALTGWLSGSGSSVLCVARAESAPTVATAMCGAFTAAGVESEVRVLTADNTGLRVLG